MAHVGYVLWRYGRLMAVPLINQRENLASTHVLNKLGMTFREVAEEDGLFWLIYTIDRETFERINQPAAP